MSDQPNVIKYKADYTLTPQIYQVFYYVDGAYYKAEEIGYGANLDEAPRKAGEYIFSGWFLDEGYSEPFIETTMPARDLVLYGYFDFDVRRAPIPKVKLSYSEESNDVVSVYADMIINPGFSGMTLTLNYDKSAMRFIGFEKGATFKDLQFDKTETDGGLDVDEFKFYYEHSENTYETGVFLILKFKLLRDAEVGLYGVTFTLNNSNDATYRIGNSSDIKYTAIEFVGAYIPVGGVVAGGKMSDAAVILITLPILLAIATMSYVLIIIGKHKKMKEKID